MHPATPLLCSFLLTASSPRNGGAELRSLDLDGDGLADLALVDASGAPRLLRHSGEARFVEIDGRGGLPERVDGIHWQDLDGDGDLDALALDGGGPRVFENAGPWVFVEIEGAFGLVTLDPRGAPQWLDLDGDGRLDLVWSAPSEVQLLRQVRRGVFAATSVLAVGSSTHPAALLNPPGPVIVSTRNMGSLSSSAPPTLICAGTLVDSATGNCIEASSAPVLGELYPLTADFNLDSQGWVGVGTTAPGARLDVAGVVRAQGGVRFGDGTQQATAGTRDWNALVNVPAGFADGVDDDTTYTAGTGLALTGTAFSLASGGINTAELANSAVTSAKLADSAVSSAKLANAAVSSAKLADGAVSSAKLASDSVGAAKLASDAAALAKVTGGGASMGAGALMINTATPAGRVRVRHSSSTASPHLMLTQDGGSSFSRIGMDNTLSQQTWTLAGSLTSTAATDRMNVFHSTAGDVLSIGGNNRVGVNNVNPLTALHVNGSLHLQGTGQDITIPPSETLQIGHFDGTTFTPRMLINQAGTTSLTGDVAVGGTLSAAPLARIRTYSAAQFSVLTGFQISPSGAGAPLSNFFLGTVPNASCRAYAGVNLPSGSVVTRFAVSLTDRQPSANVTASLVRKNFDAAPGNGTPGVMASAVSTGSGGGQLRTDTSISNGVIDTANFSYYVELATDAPSVGEQGIDVYAVQIEYITGDPLE